MSTLDRNKPFGEIYGDETGKRYEQNGKFYNAAGIELLDKNAKPAPAPAAPKAEVKPDPAKPSVVDQQLAAQ